LSASERVTITLPVDLIRDIDRLEVDRSRFLLDAARREVKRRRRDELRRSLDNPHPESAGMSRAGFDEWAASLPDEDAAALVDSECGTDVRWVPGEGWTRLGD
jgi:hypothetical protein